MAGRTVNLDSSPRKAVTLQLAGESFTIRRVVTGAQQLWLAFVAESTIYLKRIDAYQNMVGELQNKPGAAEKIRKATESITQDIDAFAEMKLERLLGIIELLLIKNGYTFDWQWWIDNADESDYREFIASAMLKDQEGAKKNGAAEGPSDGTV